MTTMRNFYFPLALVVAGMLFYHLAQKSIPKGINPFYAMIIAYVVGIIVLTACALMLPGDKSFVSSFTESNWAVLLVGAAAACVELGFLLAYRSGWRISVAAVASNVAVTLLLSPDRNCDLQRSFVSAKYSRSGILCLRIGPGRARLVSGSRPG